jgi:hypothetical protein
MNEPPDIGRGRGCLGRHDELGVLGIATPDLAFDDGRSGRIDGFLALDRMARDIFPDLGVPVLYVAQPYGGLDPAQMEGFIVNYYEYHFLYITGIEHVESKSIQGVALIKLQFHPGTDMGPGHG